MPAAMFPTNLSAVESSSRKPNIVFVFADQMRAHSLGCMGNQQVITPHLDQLAREGLLVTNAISCHPACTPYRAALLTGRYGHSTGVTHNEIRLPDDELVLSQIMKQQGYATGYIGKWHLAGYRSDPVDPINRRGWDFWAVRNCTHKPSSPTYWVNESREPVHVPGWEPDVQTDLAVEFIRKRKRSPFCLFVSFGPPHGPYTAPRKYIEMYQGRKLQSRPNVPVENLDVLLHYYAMITSLDFCMSRIRKALHETGIAEDTILCFTSDHGDMLGSQGHLLKQRPWEESINVPFILRYPRGIKRGQRRDWIVSSVDVMPTLLGLCGIPIPSQVQGLDLSATFIGSSQRQRQAAFLFNRHAGYGPGTDWRGIRTKEWVYAYHAAGDWILYDVRNDPYQLKNLIEDPGFAPKKRELRAQLDVMRKDLGEYLWLKGKPPQPIRLPG